jgi:hypothetical protein
MIETHGYLIESFIRHKKIQVDLREPERKPPEDGGYVFTFIRIFLCKCLVLKYLEARRVEPLFR